MAITQLSYAANVPTQNNTWRGLKIEKENRCSAYNRLQDYSYSQEIENKIVKALGNKIYSPYSGQYFKSTQETDIEHIVSISEAHDSGLCAADKETKNKFAFDIKNLTLASPTVNRDEKSGHDAASWLPKENKCWFANKVIEVKRAYKLAVDSKELIALEQIISDCKSFEMVFLPYSQIVKDTNNVRKSRSGVCHAKSSSPYYTRLKKFTEYKSLKLCLNSGGRCPKKDSVCNALKTTKV